MTLAEQARRRLELAREIGREPVRWIATQSIAEQLLAEAPEDWQPGGGAFLDLPLERAEPRWGLVLETVVAEDRAGSLLTPSPAMIAA